MRLESGPMVAQELKKTTGSRGRAIFVLFALRDGRQAFREPAFPFLTRPVFLLAPALFFIAQPFFLIAQPFYLLPPLLAGGLLAFLGVRTR